MLTVSGLTIASGQSGITFEGGVGDTLTLSAENGEANGTGALTITANDTGSSGTITLLFPLRCDISRYYGNDWFGC